MQNRKSSPVNLLTLLDSYFANALSDDVYTEPQMNAQRFEKPVGMSPSPVQPVMREEQDLMTEGEKGGGIQQVSQGGKQESLSKASPIGGVSAEHNRAVAESAHMDAQMSASLCQATVSNGGTQDFQGQGCKALSKPSVY